MIFLSEGDLLIMPEKVNFDKLSKDVKVIRNKDHNRAIIQVLRSLKDSTKEGQFGNALILIGQFDILINVLLGYIQEKDLERDFLDMLYSHSPQYEIYLSNWERFHKIVHKDITEVFGIE